MSVFNSISVSVLIVLLVAGVVVGLSVSGTDLVNPNTSKARAEVIYAQADHQQEIYKQQEQVSQAQAQADIQTIQREQKMLDAQSDHDIQAQQQDLEHRNFSFKLWMNLLVMSIGLIVLATAIVVVTWIIAMIMVKVRKAKDETVPDQAIIPPTHKPTRLTTKQEPKNPWTSPSYRRLRVKAAREEERNQRRNEINTQIKIYKDPARISKEEYRRRPLAGD